MAALAQRRMPATSPIAVITYTWYFSALVICFLQQVFLQAFALVVVHFFAVFVAVFFFACAIFLFLFILMLIVLLFLNFVKKNAPQSGAFVSLVLF